MGKLKRYLPSWKGWVAIVIGVVIWRKIEYVFPQLAMYTMTDWPLSYFKKD